MDTREDFSGAAHLLRIFLAHFRKTAAYRERLPDPKPKLLQSDTQFISMHAKRLAEAAPGDWLTVSVPDRIRPFERYLRSGMSTAPIVDGRGSRQMMPRPGEIRRPCQWFTSPQASSFFFTEEETQQLMSAVAADYTADLAGLDAR